MLAHWYNENTPVSLRNASVLILQLYLFRRVREVLSATREQLKDGGIMPALASGLNFHWVSRKTINTVRVGTFFFPMSLMTGYQSARSFGNFWRTL